MSISDIFAIIIPVLIIFGIPAIFLIGCIKNIVTIVKLKKKNERIKKSLVVGTIFCGIFFIGIICLYIWVDYQLSRAIAMM